MPEPMISLTGDMTIFEVADLKQALHASLVGHDTVRLDLASAGTLDASGVQLLLAAHRSGRFLLHQLSPGVIETCRRLGWDPTEQAIL